MSEHSLALITVGDKEEATSIARHLVEGRLAAGVQILQIDSVYTWQDRIVEDHEFLLIAKTRTEMFDRIKSAVESLHSYEVPPVVLVGIDQANAPYLEWIDQSVGG